MMRRSLRSLFLALLLAPPAVEVRGFDLVITVNNSGIFTPNQLAIVNQALLEAEAQWETVITGYQPGINIASVPIDVIPVTTGLASASFSSTTNQGGFTLSTSGFVNINTLEVENFADWQGPGANGLNFMDELLAHEIGHVLGIGTQWINNHVYQLNTFRYTGKYGVAAYKDEFNHSILYAPVENAGNAGTPNAHWDQFMRSSPQEGNPNDPWSLDPRVGVVDLYGRDRGLELMTGAIDPDYGEPFLARFTVESLRDLGYTVAKFEDFNGDGAVNGADLVILNANMGRTGLQIDSIRYGDANRDRQIDGADFLLWQAAARVPEPGTWALASTLSLFGATAIGYRRGSGRGSSQAHFPRP
jgi:hypothetical protein